MANVDIKANTSDAQKKIKKLKEDIEKLDKQIKSPKKYNLQTKGLNVGSIAGGAGLGSRAMGMAVAGGSMVGGLAATALSKLVNVLSAAIPALLKFGLGIDNVNGLMKKWSSSLDAYSNAPERALSNADNMDALDDERRAHGTATLAEEYGWSQAFRNVGGSEFNNQILTRIETLVEQAKAGNIEAIDTIKALDTIKGYTYTDEGNSDEKTPDYAIASHLNEMNTYEVLAEILRGYHGAKAQGDYTKIDALTKFLGRRGVGIANKLGDVSDVERQRATLAAEWNRIHTNESSIMDKAAEAEIIRSKGNIYNYGVPASGEGNIITGAKNEADTAELTYKALAGTNDEIKKSLTEEISKDWDATIEKIKENPIGKAINDNIVEPITTATKNAVEAIEKFNEFSKDLTPKKFIDGVKEKVINDFNQMRDEAVEDFNKSKVGHAVNTYGKWGKDAYNYGFDTQLNAAASVFKFISPFLPQKDKIVAPTTEVNTPAPSEGQIKAFGDNAYKPLVEDNPFYEAQKKFEEELVKKAEAAGEAIPEFLDPATFNERFYKEFVNPPKQENKAEQQQKQEEQKQSQAVITALGEVANNLKTSTAATNHMTQTLQKGITLNSSGTGTSTATFA